MRVAIELVTIGNQREVLIWLSDALRQHPRIALESVNFPDATEPNVGVYSEGVPSGD